MKRMIEINDNLYDYSDEACDEVKEALIRYLNENKPDRLPCLNNDLDYGGTIHEIVDGSVPIYTKDINDCWYLHANELETAYENAGVGNNPRENNGMAAIYFFIMDKVNEWYQDNAQEVFDDWQAEEEKTQKRISD